MNPSLEKMTPFTFYIGIKNLMYNDGEGKWATIQELVEARTGRPGPKKSSGGLNEVKDMEAMTADNNAKTGKGEHLN